MTTTTSDGWGWDESYPPSIYPPPPPSPPTGATPGKPGAWTPAGSDVPDTLAQANGLGLSLGAAWSVAGDYVELADASDVYWTGTAFAAGVVPTPPPPEEDAAPKRTRRKATPPPDEETTA